ncbi:MAG: hypothetical protein KatS3mg010_0167 [Acidimicrobiia bacterium]|nr:MAG: hypothetical protein KatS3mg010_0167 [Acidimicrobiia bacterium]
MPAALPALLHVQKLLRKADSIGLDPGLPAVDVRDDDSAGAALAAIVAAGRASGVDAESALSAWARGFRRRFEAMERLAAARGVDLAQADAAAVAALWAQAQEQ